MKTINSFKNLVSQKSCVVIAPSYYLKGRQLGALIDEFDIVAKCNDFYEYQEGSNDDLGGRCDIWYGLPQQRSYQFDYEKCKNVLNPKHLRIHSRYHAFKELWDESMTEFNKKNKIYNFDYSVIESDWYDNLAKIIGCIPMTGIIAIVDLLNHGASKVHALGFDFMKSGYYDESPVDLNVLQNGWHNTLNLKLFLHELMLNEKRFSPDSYLKCILNSEFSEKFDCNEAFNLNLNDECKKFFHPDSHQPLLLMQTSNRFYFDETLSLIRGFNENPPIHIICTSENSNDSSENQIFFHANHEKTISPQSIEDIETLKDLQFQYCLICYNGQGLHEYLNVFEVLKDLKCSKVFLLSKFGFLRLIENLELYILEINEFLSTKSRFDYLNSKYNRKFCI